MGIPIGCWFLVLGCHLGILAQNNASKEEKLILCTTRCNVNKKTRTRTCATVCEPKRHSPFTFTESKYENFRRRMKVIEGKRQKILGLERQAAEEARRRAKKRQWLKKWVKTAVKKYQEALIEKGRQPLREIEQQIQVTRRLKRQPPAQNISRYADPVMSPY